MLSVGGTDGIVAALAGDAQGEHGDEGAAGDGVVGGLGAGHALNAAVAELLFLLGELAGGVVAQEAGDGGAGARQNADQVADDPGPAHGGGDLPHLLPGQHHLVIKFCGSGPLFNLLLRQDQRLTHGEQSDESAGGVDPLIEGGLAEHEALHALHGVHTDGGEQQAQRAGDQALYHGLGADAGDDGQTEDGQPEILRGGGVVPASSPEPPPQAHRLSSINAARKNVSRFFFVCRFLSSLKICACVVQS